VTTVVELSVVTPTAVELQVVEGEVSVASTSPSTVEIVGVEAAGPRGPQGEPGAQGPQGEPGTGGVASYTHVQGATSAVWTVTHNLGFRPNVQAVDTLDRVMIGDVEHVSANELTISFAVAVSGKAYAS
jgi:hypothetical protein